MLLCTLLEGSAWQCGALFYRAAAGCLMASQLGGKRRVTQAIDRQEDWPGSSMHVVMLHACIGAEMDSVGIAGWAQAHNRSCCTLLLPAESLSLVPMLYSLHNDLKSLTNCVADSQAFLQRMDHYQPQSNTGQCSQGLPAASLSVLIA